MCIDVVVVIRELGFELIVFLDVVSRFYFLDVLLFNLIQSQSGFPFPHGVVKLNKGPYYVFSSRVPGPPGVCLTL